MMVNELAQRAGVTAHAVRYYVKAGLLKPARNLSNGYKQFANGDVGRAGAGPAPAGPHDVPADLARRPRASGPTRCVRRFRRNPAVKHGLYRTTSATRTCPESLGGDPLKPRRGAGRSRHQILQDPHPSLQES